MTWLLLLLVIGLSICGAWVLGQLAFSVNRIEGAAKQVAGFVGLLLLTPVVGIGPIVAGAAIFINRSESFGDISWVEIVLVILALLTNYLMQYWAFRVGTRQTTDRDRATWRIYP